MFEMGDRIIDLDSSLEGVVTAIVFSLLQRQKPLRVTFRGEKEDAWCDPNNLVLIKSKFKFKMSDEVSLCGRDKGETGIIINIDKESGTFLPYCVEITSGHKYWVSEKHLELYHREETGISYYTNKEGRQFITKIKLVNHYKKTVLDNKGGKISTKNALTLIEHDLKSGELVEV